MEKRKSKIIWGILIIAAVFCLVKCSSLRYTPSRSYLTQNENERTGFGLYSYLLFSERPNKSNRTKYLKILKTYHDKLEEVEDLKRYIRRDSLNVIYLPLKYKPEPSLYYSEEDKKYEWLLKNYDYSRAKFYINKVESKTGRGPLFISYSKPLSQVGTITKEYLVQDLSGVHEDVAVLWVEKFLEVSSKPHYWDEEGLKDFTHELRNKIAIGAEALVKSGEALNFLQSIFIGK